MSYTKTNWQNTPSTQTPISAANLNHMEQGIYDAAQTADSAQSGVDGLDPRMDLVEQRLDNLIPQGTPTQGNAELIDIRVGANGVTYPDAGSAVRGQYTAIKSALTSFETFAESKIGTSAISITDLTQYIPDSGALGSGYVWSNVGNNNFQFIVVPIPVTGCHMYLKVASNSPADLTWGFVTEFDTPVNGESYHPASVNGRYQTAIGGVANFDIPNDAKFMILNIVWGGNTIIFDTFSISKDATKGSIENDIDGIESDITSIEGKLVVHGKNMVNPSDIDDGYIGSTGTIYENPTYKTTGYISIKNGKPITMSPKVRIFAVFDTDKVAIPEKYYNEETSVPYTYTPTNDGFVRVTFFASDISTFQIEMGNIATTYEPYAIIPIDEKVEELSYEVSTLIKEGVKVLIIGDSYSHNENCYIKYLRAHINITDLVNLSVVSAHLKDEYADRTLYPYDGRPVTGGSGNNNTLNNQIAKLERLMEGTDLDEGETQIYTSSADYPDIIFLEGGKNDSPDASDDYDSEMWTAVQGYRYVTGGAVTYGTTYLPADLDTINRTNFGGAMHYQYKTLHTLFPNAKIFFITPSGVNYSNADHTWYMTKSDQMRKAARHLCTPTIDWDLEGRLSYVDNVVNGDGTQENPYTRNASSEYTVDSLHPNLAGGNLLGECICAKLRTYGYIN